MVGPNSYSMACAPYPNSLKGKYFPIGNSYMAQVKVSNLRPMG